MLAGGIVGSISALSNSGVVSGGTIGVENQGAIGTLTNTGTITGGEAGIVNETSLYSYEQQVAAIRSVEQSVTTTTSVPTITAITNTGLIYMGYVGIANGGALGAINNTGTIFGTIAGIELAAPGTTINNMGTIYGSIAALDLGAPGNTIINGGTIASDDYAVYFGGVNDLILTTGSDIVGTIDGGGTDSQIALTNSGELDAPIGDFGGGGALAVSPGAAWTGTGSWTIPTITNDGSTHLMEKNIEIVPAAGMRVATVGGGSNFAEAATGLAQAFAVSGKTSGYTSVRPYAVVNASQSFLLPSGWALRPNAEAGYEYEAGPRGVSTTLIGADGTVFQTPHNDLDPSAVLLGAGLTAGKANWSLFANYTAHLSGNWNTQTAEAGLRYTF